MAKTRVAVLSLVLGIAFGADPGCQNGQLFGVECYPAACADPGGPACDSTIYCCKSEFELFGRGDRGCDAVDPPCKITRDVILVSQAMPYLQAKAYCESTYQATIASVTGLYENQDMKDLCLGTGANDCWIGLDDIAVTGTWTYQDGSSYEYFNFWLPNEPSPGEHCAAITTNSQNPGRWNNLPCELTRPFFCNPINTLEVLPIPPDLTEVPLPEPSLVSPGIDVCALFNIDYYLAYCSTHSSDVLSRLDANDAGDANLAQAVTSLEAQITGVESEIVTVNARVDNVIAQLSSISAAKTGKNNVSNDVGTKDSLRLTLYQFIGLIVGLVIVNVMISMCIHRSFGKKSSFVRYKTVADVETSSCDESTQFK